jgi:hypothetical protein
MRNWLIAAGIYNLLWGAAVIAFPLAIFDFAGMEPPRYPMIWQCVGMIVGVYGVGYLAAATNALKHWPIVLVGFLGKVLGPIGFVAAAGRGDLPWAWGVTILTNDLIWWVPFALMLRAAYRTLGGRYPEDSAAGALPLGEALARASTHDGRSALEVTREQPTLVLFLRHAGCIFCSETAAQVAEQLERAGREDTPVVAVHMGESDESIRKLLERQGLGRALRVSDPEGELYRAVELERGSLGQLFGWRVWLAGWRAFMKGHRVGPLQGDGLRMPGLFLISGETILSSQRPEHAGGELNAERVVCELPA